MSRYQNNLYTRPVVLDTENKRRYYNSLLSPTIPKRFDDIYVVTTIGDRVDLLAFDYYADVTLKFIIFDANPELRKDSLYLEPGLQLRIPRDSQITLALYQEQNSLQ